MAKKQNYTSLVKQIKSQRKAHTKITKHAVKQLTLHKPHYQNHARMPYTNLQSILLIGEGNFSFASSLLNLIQSDTITATAFDSEEIVKEKYTDASDNMKELVCLFDIDGTRLHQNSSLRSKRYQRIVFNFPHVGAGIKDMHRNVIANQTLILEFFKSAQQLLALDGEIHVTLKSGIPYDLWDIRELAKQAGLFSKWTLPFDASLYPGYEHRRTLGFTPGVSQGENEEILVKECKTYSFTKEQQNVIKKKKKRNDSDDE